MTEINNNNMNYDTAIRKVKQINQPEKAERTENLENIEEQNIKAEQAFVEDTGVLGRSLLLKSNGGNIAKSIDEAVFIALNHPEILEGGEELFNAAEDYFKQQGLNEEEAYFSALLAQEEFNEIANTVIKNR